MLTETETETFCIDCQLLGTSKCQGEYEGLQSCGDFKVIVIESSESK